MLKQSPSRNQRTKGFKMKQGFKIFILIAVGIWLIYQLKHSHNKNKTDHGTKELGRKGLNSWTKNLYELIDDTEESKHDRVKEQSNGGDDDIIIGHDRDRTEEEEPEEVEDLIDEEDKEKEEENEDEDGEIVGKQIEDIKLLEGQGHSNGGKDTQVTSEKHYRENGASRIVMRFGGLRKLKAIELENSEKKQEKILYSSTDSSPEVVENVQIELGYSPNVWLIKGKDGVLNSADSGSGPNSDSLLNREFD